MASTRGGTELSSDEIGWKPRSFSQPHWNTITRLPYAAATDSTVISTPLNARNTDRMEISNITNATVDTNRNTPGWVRATRSSKSLISAVGPPTSMRVSSAPGTCGSCWRIQEMVSRADMSSGSTDNTADSSALLLSSANDGGCTVTMLGASRIRIARASTTGLCCGPDAPPSGNATSTRTGPSPPGPSARAAALTPPRISCVGGNCRCMLLDRVIDSAGAARVSSSTAAPSADAHGLRITQPIQRLQNGDWVDSGRRDQCSIRDRLAAVRPNIANTAGTSVTDVSTATATVSTAPVAIDRNTGVLIRY